MAREFVMLAHTFDPIKHNPAAWFASEKLDGMRCYWDGGITRGLPTFAVPWANTAKDGRYLSMQIATGLWSRYAKAIQAPDWFLDQLPKIPLDGELWMGLGGFQKVMSTVKDLKAGPDWKDVKFMVFDAPSYIQVFLQGEVKKIGKKFFNILPWIESREPNPGFINVFRRFTEVQELLQRLELPDFVKIHQQKQLNYDAINARKELEAMVDTILTAGGEGVILRNPASTWAPQRMWSILKYKPTHDAEGVVVGFTWGRETDLGSKLLGKMGALIVEWQGKRFKISGFTDEERSLTTPFGPISLTRLAHAYQGMENTNPQASVTKFPIGSTVTFTYRELTDEGIPKEARYLRKRGDE